MCLKGHVVPANENIAVDVLIVSKKISCSLCIDSFRFLVCKNRFSVLKHVSIPPPGKVLQTDMCIHIHIYIYNIIIQKWMCSHCFGEI